MINVTLNWNGANAYQMGKEPGVYVDISSTLADATVVRLVDGKTPYASWPTTTIGEIRQWLAEKADAARLRDSQLARELADAAIATQARLAQADANNSPGAKAEGMETAGPATTTPAAAPGFMAVLAAPLEPAVTPADTPAESNKLIGDDLPF